MTDTKPLLDGVKDISDLRSMSDEDLTNLAGEVRVEMIEAVERLNDERGPDADRVAVGVGINAGEPIEDQDDLFGTVVIQAPE